MKKILLHLDSLGIISPDDNEGEYSDGGVMALEAAARLKIDDSLCAMSLKEGLAPKILYKMLPSVAADFKKMFRTDVSWIPLVAAKSADEKRMGASVLIQYSSSVDKFILPVVFYIRGGRETIFHEAIHSVRSFNHDEDKAFEESFAFYNDPTPSHSNFEKQELFFTKLAIVHARKRLEDKIGDKASYALIRMTKEEVYDIRLSSDVLGYVKGLDTLRMRIVKERLGL